MSATPKPLRYRLGRNDWRVINAALALLEADADDDPLYTDAEIKATRRKVWERMARTGAEPRIHTEA